jgi:glycosyltransferase involved in cell wall biosynthesis
LGLVVHEPFVPMVNWRWALMGLWQRVQLWTIAACADPILVTTEGWRARVRGRRAVAVLHLPVGSNLPDMRAVRARIRRRHGWPSEQVVLAAFGTADPARMQEHIVAAANRVAGAGLRVSLLNLGAGAPPLRGIARSTDVITPGPLPERAIAEYLGAADVFLAPYADGLSTRRTTLMAALQHALAVVGTRGPATDAALLDSGDALVLVPAGRREEFADATLRLAGDSRERDERRRLGRALYELEFDWPVLAERLAAALTE